MLNKLIKTTLFALSLSFSSATFAELVNINTADIKTIQDNLKGIGEKKAQAIIDYRTEKGGFKTLEEIQEVKGIGPKLFEKIKVDISLTEGLGKPQVPSNNSQTPTKAVDSTTAKEITKDAATPAKTDKAAPKS